MECKIVTHERPSSLGQMQVPNFKFVPATRTDVFEETQPVDEHTAQQAALRQLVQSSGFSRLPNFSMVSSAGASMRTWA
jgi:hypothetical protein